ncbi:MAG: glycine betaine/L-proline ABC transporter ATP-binding protein [Bacillota bacterium]
MMEMRICEDAEPKLVVDNLYKVFGCNQQRAVSGLKSGACKETIKEEMGSTVGVNEVSFEVYPGEMFIVMGLSGSGKSTLLRCVNRLTEPTAGDIYIDGQSVVSMSQHELRQLRRNKLGMVFQQFALFPHRTVLDNTAYGLEVQGMSRAKRYRQAEEILNMVGLDGWGSSYPGNLSGGMQQRVGLARALVHDPDILLMDEPFSALDPLIRREMQNELLQLQEELNKTILFITHDLDEAMRLGDRIAIMNDGKIVQIGTAQQILMNPANDYVRAFVEDVDRFKVLTTGEVMVEPEPLLHPEDSLQSAVHDMEDCSSWYAPVVSSDERFLGMISSEEAAVAATNGTRSIVEILNRDVHRATGREVLQDVVSIIARESLPVAVVDERNHLRGIVDASAMLSGLIEGPGEEPDQRTDLPRRRAGN